MAERKCGTCEFGRASVFIPDGNGWCNKYGAPHWAAWAGLSDCNRGVGYELKPLSGIVKALQPCQNERESTDATAS